MEELRPEQLEELVQELEEEYGALVPIPRKVRVCPECGKHNLEDAWHCSECSATLSIETLTDKGAAKSPAAAKTLAPSELILLNGDRFATTSSAAVKLGEWVRLVHMDADAEATELGETMLAAAFLANEQAEAIHLEVRQEKALFGLFRRDKLCALRGDHRISWPAHSLESQLWPLAGKYVSEAVADWLGGEYRSAWKEVGNRVRAGLASRGLLETQRKAGIKGFLLGASYVLPAETAALATQQSLEPIRQLLATCRRTRPEVWRLLIEGINKGIGWCEKEDDPSPW